MSDDLERAVRLFREAQQAELRAAEARRRARVAVLRLTDDGVFRDEVERESYFERTEAIRATYQRLVALEDRAYIQPVPAAR